MDKDYADAVGVSLSVPSAPSIEGDVAREESIPCESKVGSVGLRIFAIEYKIITRKPLFYRRPRLENCGLGSQRVFGRNLVASEKEMISCVEFEIYKDEYPISETPEAEEQCFVV